MKKYIFSVTAVIIITGIILSLSRNVNARKMNSTVDIKDKTSIVDTFFPNDNQVCFYENDNYGGKQICISSTGKIDDLAQHFLEGTTTPWVNKISSVIIGKNACAFMYVNYYEQGTCLILRGNGASQRRIPKLSPFNFNDKTRSIRSYAYPSNYPPDPEVNEVFFFEHTNYDGRYISLKNGEDANNLSQPLHVFNDQISSIKLGVNTCLNAWNDANFKGKHSGYRANGSTIWRIPDLHNVGVGDKFSSLKVRHKDSCAQKW